MSKVEALKEYKCCKCGGECKHGGGVSSCIFCEWYLSPAQAKAIDTLRNYSRTAVNLPQCEQTAI